MHVEFAHNSLIANIDKKKKNLETKQNDLLKTLILSFNYVEKLSKIFCE